MPSLYISIGDPYRTLGRIRIRRYRRYVSGVSGYQLQDCFDVLEVRTGHVCTADDGAGDKRFSSTRKQTPWMHAVRTNFCNIEHATALNHHEQKTKIPILNSSALPPFPSLPFCPTFSSSQCPPIHPTTTTKRDTKATKSTP